MSNDIERYSPGGLQPYSQPGELQPTRDEWGDVPDYLSDRQQHSSAPQWFGTPLPPGATQEHVERVISMISGSYMASMANWGHPANLINAAITWFRASATQPPRHEQQRHPYELHSQSGDPLAESFANYMARYNAPQEFISNSIYFIEELERQQNNGSGHDRPQAMDGSNTDQLDDQTYNALYDYNEKMKPHTQDILRAKWKDSYYLNLQMVDQYLHGLSAVEQEHFDRFLDNGLHALNDPTVILGLYEQAVGSGSIPRSGAALQDEIAACEACMKYERKKWLSDERLQARYRHLLTLRDG
jgi:hypothetical protein